MTDSRAGIRLGRLNGGKPELPRAPGRVIPQSPQVQSGIKRLGERRQEWSDARTSSDSSIIDATLTSGAVETLPDVNAINALGAAEEAARETIDMLRGIISKIAEGGDELSVIESTQIIEQMIGTAATLAALKTEKLIKEQGE